jgi:hypothetical protein
MAAANTSLEMQIVRGLFCPEPDIDVPVEADCIYRRS